MIFNRQKNSGCRKLGQWQRLDNLSDLMGDKT